MAPETQSADTREAADPTTDDLLVTPRASVHEVTADVLQLSAGLEIPGKTSEEVAAMIQVCSRSRVVVSWMLSGFYSDDPFFSSGAPRQLDTRTERD